MILWEVVDQMSVLNSTLQELLQTWEAGNYSTVLTVGKI